MWGKFFAFAMLVLIVLVIIQFSTLSDDDVEKIKSQIEERQKNQQNTKDVAPVSESITGIQSKTTKVTTDDPVISQPPVIAYNAFLDAVPAMKFDSEINQYLMPEAVEHYKTLFAGFSSDMLEAFKSMHDFKDLEYMKFRYIDDKTAVIHFIASNGLMRQMSTVVSGGDNEEETLDLFEVVMRNNADQWMVQKEVAEQISNPGFGIDLKEKYRPLLEEYNTKRKAHTE